MKGRFNLFQASMLRWREQHPYNGIHVFRVQSALDRARLEDAINDVVGSLGVGRVDIDTANRRYEYASETARIAVDVLPQGRTLETEIERQLNLPFPPSGRIDPLRFFALDRADRFDLGLAYDHVIAAGDSIVRLLKAIADRYAGHERATVMPGIDRYPPTYRSLFARHPFATLAGLRRIPAFVRTLRHAYRPRYPHGDALDMSFLQCRIEPAGVERLRGAAKRWDVTVNDLVMALLIAALAPFTEARHAKSRRNELAVASIVNIRGDCGKRARAAFGQFLSSFIVAHRAPPGVALETLARDVGAAAARVKREKLYLQTLIAMGTGGLAWRLLTREQRSRFHGKAYPVWAGMTSLNIDALWPAAPGLAPVPEYLRAGPTGPLVPLAVAVTTAAGRIELGLSFRRAAFTRDDIVKMAASMLTAVQAL
jgi:hypothetical protein